MRNGLLVLLFLFSSHSMAEGSNKDVGPDVISGYLSTTDLGKNLQTLEDYYAEVNRQLDQQMRRTPRDPFAELPQSGSPEPVKSRFIPKKSLSQTVAEGADKTAMKIAGVNLGALPEMQFRGFMKSDGGKKAGLLEINEQGTFVVHEGDQVGLRQNGGEMVIRVVEINALNLIVEFGSIGAKVVVQ